MWRLITFLMRRLITLSEGFRRMVIISCWSNITVRGHKIVWNRSWRKILLDRSRSWWRIFEWRSRTSWLVVVRNQIMTVMMRSRLVGTSWCWMVSIFSMVIMMTSCEPMFGWRRTYETCRFPKVWFLLCFILEDIRRERSSIADSITVPEVSVVPLLLRKYKIVLATSTLAEIVSPGAGSSQTLNNTERGGGSPWTSRRAQIWRGRQRN